MMKARVQINNREYYETRYLNGLARLQLLIGSGLFESDIESPEQITTLIRVKAAVTRGCWSGREKDVQEAPEIC
jgi:hypothetical protein